VRQRIAIMQGLEGIVEIQLRRVGIRQQALHATGDEVGEKSLESLQRRLLVG